MVARFSSILILSPWTKGTLIVFSSFEPSFSISAPFLSNRTKFFCVFVLLCSFSSVTWSTPTPLSVASIDPQGCIEAQHRKFAPYWMSVMPLKVHPPDVIALCELKSDKLLTACGHGFTIGVGSSVACADATMEAHAAAAVAFFAAMGCSAAVAFAAAASYCACAVSITVLFAISQALCCWAINAFCLRSCAADAIESKADSAAL
mmetsp:Transcript_32497/g.64018  ORF Transcript_32497/g.64018 Transcript_32497/m.64018 type:complete len:205 (+) Transcript_32497:346-960(+)